MSSPVLLGLCGSLRAGSLNRKLMLQGARLWPGTFVEGDLRLPLYDGDVEAMGLPPSVRALCDAIAGADAVLIACPEYNKGPSGVLKNALDWISRDKPNPLWGKRAGIVSATAGRSGGERAQTMLRSMLAPLRVEALTWPEVLVGGAANEFDDQGRLSSARYQETLAQLIGRLAQG